MNFNVWYHILNCQTLNSEQINIFTPTLSLVWKFLIFSLSILLCTKKKFHPKTIKIKDLLPPHVVSIPFVLRLLLTLSFPVHLSYGVRLLLFSLITLSFMHHLSQIFLLYIISREMNILSSLTTKKIDMLINSTWKLKMKT
jgi:hypothetical protein